MRLLKIRPDLAAANLILRCYRANSFLREHHERLVVCDSGFGLCRASRTTIIAPSALVIIHAHDLESDDADFEADGIRYPRC
jgi:hypothetical protein